MADREKVFDALRNCVTEPKCKDCPWEDCEKIGCKRTKVPVTLLLDTLKLLKEQPHWISVKDRMPGIDEDVLILYESKVSPRETGYAITCLKDSFYFGCTPIPYSKPQWSEPWQYFRENNVITHWMPLPEPPKEVKQDENIR